MRIRRAEEKDMEGINRLLYQVGQVHHNGRPDLFRSGGKKYTDSQLKEILEKETSPVFVAVDEQERVLGYAFCILQQHRDSTILTDIKTLYIDDLCVEETLRGHRIGKQLYEQAAEFAKQQGCYNLTLNVWSCNEEAIKFYEHCGMKPQKIGMEVIL